MKTITLYIGIMILALLTACSFHGVKRDTGNPIDERKVAQIIDGTTTGIEAVGIFGAPTVTSKIADTEAYIYKHCRTSGSGFSFSGIGNTSTAERCNTLTVVVDQVTGIVRKHSFQKVFDAE